VEGLSTNISLFISIYYIPLKMNLAEKFEILAIKSKIEKSPYSKLINSFSKCDNLYIYIVNYKIPKVERRVKQDEF